MPKLKKPSIRAKKYIKNKLSGMTDRQAALAAGYSEATARSARQKVEKGVVGELLNEKMDALGITEERLFSKIDEGLEATKVISARVIVSKSKPTSQAEGELPLADSRTDDFIDIPDFIAQHKYLDTALKLRNMYPADKVDLTTKGKPINMGLDENTRRRLLGTKLS